MWSAVREWENECEMRGEARGERNGLFKGIISAYKEFSISAETAIEKLTNTHDISPDEATRYVKQYW